MNEAKEVNMKIVYQVEPAITTSEFIDVLNESTLGERRPVEDVARIEQMIKNANLFVTARVDNKLIGISRALTDFSFATYLSDLAVSREYQKMGIGRELIRRTKIASGQASLILLSAPAAVEFYPKIGMKHMDKCFWIKELSELG